MRRRLAALLPTLLAPLGLVALVLGGFPPPLLAQRIDTPDPEPFRRDGELTGRTFEYEEESFLHRFSYRFRPEAVRAWSETSEGFRGTAGSVRSDEFYVFEEFRKTLTLDDPFEVLFRHERNEDFDGRYDRTLTGAGLRIGSGWSFAVLGDVVGEKEDIDLHLELALRRPWGGIRGVFIPVDVAFDRKADQQEYERAPFTYYLEGRWRSPDGFEIWAWANANPDTRLVDTAAETSFDYAQYSAEVNLRAPLGDDWRGWLSLGGETGRRDLRAVDPLSPLERRADRDHVQCTAQLERSLGPDRSFWFGSRFFLLDERDERPGDPDEDRSLRFEEWLVYGGMAFRVHERVVFWPSLFLEYVDDEERFPLEPARDEHHEGFVGKAMFPVEFGVGRGATVTMNLGMMLHEVRFGGGNVQVQVPF